MHYGEAQVCNAVVRHATTTIRCAVWRRMAAEMGAHLVGMWTTDACINHVPQLGPADEIIKRISFALHLV